MRLAITTRAARLTAISLLVGTSACSDFPHTNPFDPAVAVDLRINGPDTITTQFDTLQFSVSSNPAYELTAEWSATTPLQRLNNNGLFRFPLKDDNLFFNNEIIIQAKVGTRTATKKVIVKFRVGGIRPCSTMGDTIRFSSLTEQQMICIYYVDRHGYSLDGAPLDPAPQTTFKVLDETVARANIPGGYGVNLRLEPVASVGNGTTGITVSGAGASLTLPIVVRQKASYLRIDECVTNGIRVKVGQQLQLHVDPVVRDERAFPVVDPFVRQAALANLTWVHTGSFLGRPFASVDQNGVITGLYVPPVGVTQGFVSIYHLVNGLIDFGSATGSCSVYVEP